MMIAISYILGFCCIVITCIGMWHCVTENNKLISIVCFLLAGASLVICFEYVIMHVESELNGKYSVVINQKDIEIKELEEKIEKMETEIFYVGATVFEQKDNGDGTFDIYFAIEYDNGNVYKWTDVHEYPDDIPYMLTMDGKGTYNLVDDEIVVVWKDMN